MSARGQRATAPRDGTTRRHYATFAFCIPWGIRELTRQTEPSAFASRVRFTRVRAVCGHVCGRQRRCRSNLDRGGSYRPTYTLQYTGEVVRLRVSAIAILISDPLEIFICAVNQWRGASRAGGCRVCAQVCVLGRRCVPPPAVVS